MVVSPAIYADATVLIALGRIGRLELLTDIGLPVYVTRQVWDEVTGDLIRPGAQSCAAAEQAGLLRVVAEGDSADFPQIDAGEASTLSAAIRTGGTVIVDEAKTRRLLRTDPVLRTLLPAPLSTIGVILPAQQQGRLAAVRPVLDELRRQAFRMTPALYEDALRAAGEWPPRRGKP